MGSVLSFSAAAGIFDEDARKEVKVLRDQVDAQNREFDQRLQKLDESIKNIGVIQLLNQIEQLNAELARLRGQVEVLANQNDQLSKRQKDFYLDIDTRLRKVEGGGDPGAPANGVPGGGVAPGPFPGSLPSGSGPGLAGATPVLAPPAAATSVTVPGAQPTVSTSSGTTTATARPPVSREQENKAYDVGSDLFRRNDYRGAIRAFETFMKDFPTSQLVSNAQYWIGVSYFNLKDYGNARATQESLVRRFPDSPKAPDAMLAIASVQQANGDAGSARNTLEDVILRYPASEAAAKARARLPAVSRR
jgi:tol-pal system protein YbgF